MLVSACWATYLLLLAAQAKCTDLVLLNKVELAGESLLEQVSKPVSSQSGSKQSAS